MFNSFPSPFLIIYADVSNPLFISVLVGQTPMQALQLVHILLSTEILLETKETAFVGQISMHKEHSLW
jgi:hypothetical protein